MAHDTSELLIGAAARLAERAALERTLEQFPEIDQVMELLTMDLGPISLLVPARVVSPPTSRTRYLRLPLDGAAARSHQVVLPGLPHPATKQIMTGASAAVPSTSPPRPQSCSR